MDLADAIIQIRPIVVQILFSAMELTEEFSREIGKPFISDVLGTGFFVSEEAHIITANHVIKEGLKLLKIYDSVATRKNLFVGIGHESTENIRGNITLVQFDIIEQDEIHDLCLIKLTKNPFTGEVQSGIAIAGTRLPLLFETPNINPNRPREGSQIGISGYPFFEKSFLVTNSGHIACSWKIERKDMMKPEAPYLPPIPSFFDVYLGDIEVNPGNSGGPVYLVEDASLIGVCVSIEGSSVWIKHGEVAEILGQNLYYSSGLTNIIPSKYVIELLEKNNVGWS